MISLSAGTTCITNLYNGGLEVSSADCMQYRLIWTMLYVTLQTSYLLANLHICPLCHKLLDIAVIDFCLNLDVLKSWVCDLQIWNTHFSGITIPNFLYIHPFDQHEFYTQQKQSAVSFSLYNRWGISQCSWQHCNTWNTGKSVGGSVVRLTRHTCTSYTNIC